MMTAARTRIGRYKPHGSHLWVMCFPDERALRADLVIEEAEQKVKDHTFHGSDVAGYAIVLWGSDGSTTAVVRNWSNIPGIVIPDLVRNRLLADKTEQWTLETLGYEV